MTPKEFEEWLEECEVARFTEMECADGKEFREAEIKMLVFSAVLSKFRTVKWDKTCEGCEWGNNKYVGKLIPCSFCARAYRDHYQPTTEGK